MRKILGQKAYPGEVPRPSTETFNFENENLFIAGTPWGSQDALKQLTDTFKDFISTSSTDQDATSPFAKLPGLSSEENALRSAALLSNDAIFSKLNKEAYTSACEALILHFHGSQVSWIQVGQPHLFLVRHNRIHPLSFALDLGLDYENLTPLPSRLFGLEKHWDLEAKSLVLQESDQLLIVGRSTLPTDILSLSTQDETSKTLIQKVTDAAIRDNQKMPFFTCLLG